MREDIPFNEIMKNHRYWHEDIDFEEMEANYKKLKPIMNKMFFEEMPEHPQFFTLLFSEKGFADRLLKAGITLKITNLNRIYFKEFSADDRNTLIEKGVLSPVPTMLGLSTIMFAKNGDNMYINMIL